MSASINGNSAGPPDASESRLPPGALSRLRRRPLIVFRAQPAGRRAALVGGPDVWEVIAGVLGGDEPAAARIDRAVETFGPTRDQVESAVDYCAEFPVEVDDAVAENRRMADEAEAAWRRGQSLLSV